MLAGVTFCWHLSPLADREDYAVIERSGEFTKTHASKGGRSGWSGQSLKSKSKLARGVVESRVR